MQMFNGITMKILGLHSVSFDQPIESRKAEETYENSENDQLKKIRTEINELNDGENTANDKIEIQGTLNKEFAEFLKNKPEIAKQLWEAVNLISAEEGSDNAKAKADLVAFLKPIINPVDIKQDITDLNEETGKFYEKNLDKSKGTITNVKSTIDDIFGIIGEEAQEGENENITKYRNTINNIKKVLDKPNETNTKALQKFILANLDPIKDKDAYDAFLKGNFKDKNIDKPDGKFGQATFDGVHAFLTKLNGHVNDIKDAEDVMKNNEVTETPVDLSKVTLKEELNLTGGEVAAKDLLNLPEGNIKVEFEGNTGIKIDEGVFNKPQNVTVIVNNKKRFNIIATVVKENNDTTKLKLQQQDAGTTTEIVPNRSAESLKLDGKEYPVANDAFAKKYNQVLYYVNPIDNNSANEGGGTQTPEIINRLPEADVNGDREYLMHTENGDYKIKLDNNGNLKPLVENFNSGVKVLVKNNPSCMVYLQNKIPVGLPGNPRIAWNDNMEDYVIRTNINGKIKGNTIEPMELDGHGVSPNLSEHLIMMNFVHFLRLNEKIDDIAFDPKNDPDLKFKDGELLVSVDSKSYRTYDENGNVVKKGGWYKVPLERFGLNRIEDNREEKFKNLIKFNNGEHWEDDWDKKKENKYYDKIALEGEAQVLGDVTSHGNDGRIPERTVANPYGAAIEGVGMIRFDETFVTKLGVFEDGEFKFNEGVEKTETDGSKYIEDSEGNKFKKDVENGLGYRKINGYLLMGNFKSGKLDGNGLVIAANGDTFIGEFKDGKIDGKGKRIHQIFGGPCVTLDGTFNDVGLISGKCILGTESYNVRWDENEGKLLIVDGAEESTRYIDLTNGVVYNLGQERDFRLDEVVVARNYLRPKNPINFGSESEELLDGKTGKLDGVGAFDGNGNFNFIEEIKENDVDGKKTITINNETYTGVEYTKGKGLSIQPFTGNGYQRGDSGVAKWFFIGEYNAEEKKGTGKRIFENGAVYDGKRKDTLENGRGTYTYPNGDKYEGNFVDGQFNGEGTYTWKNGCSYVGNFENDNMTEGLLKLNTGTFKVKKDAKGLVVTEGDSRGKYIDIKKGTVVDASTSPTETVEVKSYHTILEAVENGKVKVEAINDDGKGNKYIMIGNEKYFYYVGKPNALAPYINYCIQYEDKVYFGKLNPSKGIELEGGQYVDKGGKITAVETNLTAADEETGTHETPVVELDLSQYRNSDSKIDLSSLTTLTKAQAEILATTSGTLILDGLKTIDADIAEKLNKHEGFLSLNGIENLSKDVADKFKNRKSTMSFNSIKKFEQGVSEFIGTSEGGLSLAGLEEISNEDAKNIGKHKGIMIHENDSFNNTITLSSLKHITVEQAKLLGKFEGEIQLNGLESLDEQTAKELGESKLTFIYFDNPDFEKMVGKYDYDKVQHFDKL